MLDLTEVSEGSDQEEFPEPEPKGKSLYDNAIHCELSVGAPTGDAR